MADTTGTPRAQATEEFVDNSAGVEETDALLASVIGDIENEYEDEDLAALPDGEAEPEEKRAAPVLDDDGNEVEVPAEEAPAEEAAPADEEEEDPDDRSIARLVKREVDLRAKEEAFKAREARVSDLEQENTQLKAQFEELNARIPTDFVDTLRSDPYKALESVGYDPEHIVRVVLAQKLLKQGKEVPKELREEIRNAEYDYKFKQQEKQLSQIEHNRKAAEFVAKVESDGRQYVKAMSALKPEFSKDAPTVAKVAKANPERAYQEIMDEISKDASARRREPNAALISFAEAARRVEKRWTELRALTSDETPKDGSTTAAEKQASKAAPGASAQKKAVKPLNTAKPKTQAELEQEGLDAGLAEYKRVETQRRAVKR